VQARAALMVQLVEMVVTDSGKNAAPGGRGGWRGMGWVGEGGGWAWHTGQAAG
jgi:hypothetical protein